MNARICIGRCPTAANAPVHIDPDKMFGRHLAVLGNTGSGKSCSVSGLINWCVDSAARERGRRGVAGPPNARFIVLDPNGEYQRAFADIGARTFRAELEPSDEADPLALPAWLWNGQEWAAFTSASPGVQRPLLLDALRRLRSGYTTADDAGDARLRARIRGATAQVRNTIAAGKFTEFVDLKTLSAFLAHFIESLEELPVSDEFSDLAARVKRLAQEAEESGQERGSGGRIFNRPFSEVRLQHLLTGLEEFSRRLQLEPGTTTSEDAPVPFDIDDVPDLVEALAVASPARDLAQFVDSLNLRIRGVMAQGALAPIARPGHPVDLEGWLSDYIGSDDREEPVSIIDLSLVPSEATHIVVAVLARLIFEAIQRYRRLNGTELPTVLVLDEAHSFVRRGGLEDGETPAADICRRAIERIAREGRKFGLGLVLASQRPSEISPTVLSQCNTFLLHRLVNDQDQALVRRLVPDALGGLLRELPSLPTRRAILLGWAAPSPVMVELNEIPEAARPHSPDPNFWRVWTAGDDDGEREVDWAPVVRSWIETS